MGIKKVISLLLLSTALVGCGKQLEQEQQLQLNNFKSGQCGQQVINDYNNTAYTCMDGGDLNYWNNCLDTIDGFLKKYPQVNCTAPEMNGNGTVEISEYKINKEVDMIEKYLQETYGI